MLKLLVFQGDRDDAQSSAHLFVTRLNAAAPRPVADTVRYSDLVFTFTRGAACEIRIASTGKLLEQSAKGYYVRDYQGYHAERYAVATYLAGKGKKVFNSDALRNESLSKLEQLIAFAAAGIPVPNSSFAADPDLLGTFDYPYVMKSITASNNRLNFLIRSERERRRAINEIGSKVLVQEYIENDGDYKVMIMFGHPLVIYKRSRPNSYRTGKRPARKIVQEDDVAALAQKTAATLRREFCGVDIVRDKNSGKLYVLECNFNAGLYIKGIRSDKALFAETVKLLQEL
jgi:glutathione synthase/RimK-type ligase-like ATP-grasp enzyme